MTASEQIIYALPISLVLLILIDCVVVSVWRRRGK